MNVSIGILIPFIGIMNVSIGILIASVGILIHWYFEHWYFERWYFESLPKTNPNGILREADVSREFMIFNPPLLDLIYLMSSFTTILATIVSDRRLQSSLWWEQSLACCPYFKLTYFLFQKLLLSFPAFKFPVHCCIVAAHAH